MRLLIYLITLSLGLLSVGCVAPQAIKKLGFSPSALEYNDLTSIYTPRPTFAEIQKIAGKNVLYLRMNAYGTQDVWLAFHQDHIAQYLAAIEKYEQWAKIATERRELISKEITREPMHYAGVKLIFTFHTSKVTQYLLDIRIGSTGLLGTIPLEKGMVFDRQGVQELKALLINLPKEETTDQTSFYK